MKPSRIWFWSVAILLTASVGRAQDATGRISGTFTDPSGAVASEVQVTITNTANDASRKAVTNQDGYYQILAPPIGNYKVSAEHEGFRPVVTGQYKLLINQMLRVDLQLRVGTTAQTVEVGGQAASVEIGNYRKSESGVPGRILQCAESSRICPAHTCRQCDEY